MTKKIKTILVSLNERSCFESNMAMATQIARKYDAHIIGLYVIPSVILYEAPYSYGGMITYTHLNKLYRSIANDVEDDFREFLKKEDLLGEWRRLNSAGHFISDVIIDHGREADLIILGDNDQLQSDKELEARIVQATGRPVLVVPQSYSGGNGFQYSIVGWDGSREAARAAFDAIPLLSMSKKTEVLCVNTHKEREMFGDVPGAELATSLARHDIVVEAVSEKTRKSPGRALMDRAKGADLLVMGAYGHSRLRESLLGGATNLALEELPCPVLLSN